MQGIGRATKAPGRHHAQTPGKAVGVSSASWMTGSPLRRQSRRIFQPFIRAKACSTRARTCLGERGPGRKVYRLTDTGRARLRDEITQWQEFSAATDRLM